jgi:glycosyltransferase involved in cell wall biosynthesis
MVTTSGETHFEKTGATYPPIRVAYCVENLGTSGGTESNAVRTMEFINRSAVNAVVVSIGPDGPMRARYERAGHRVHRFPIGPLWHPRTYLRVLQLARFFREQEVEIVHCNDIYTNWVGVIAARLAGRPRVIASKRWTHEGDRFLAFTRRAFKWADVVLGNSQLIAESAHTIEGAARSKLVVVPNFIEPRAFEVVTDDERRRWRTSLCIDPDAIVVGCLQRLRPEKQHALLIESFVGLRLPERCQLVLAGDGPEEERLRAQVASLSSDVRDRVVLVGHVANRPNPHQLFDISVLPARSEGFPNSMLEAMAVGRAIVSTDVGGVRDALEDGVSGLVVPPSDVPAMSTALQRMLDDVAFRHASGAAALQRAHDVFAVERVLPRLIEVYRQLSASQTRGRPLAHAA